MCGQSWKIQLVDDKDTALYEIKRAAYPDPKGDGLVFGWGAQQAPHPIYADKPRCYLGIFRTIDEAKKAIENHQQTMEKYSPVPK